MFSFSAYDSIKESLPSGIFLTLLLISLTDNYPSHWQGMILVYGYFQGKYPIVFIIHAEIHICSVDYFYILIFIFKTEKFLLFISKFPSTSTPIIRSFSIFAAFIILLKYGCSLVFNIGTSPFSYRSGLASNH